MNDALQIQKSTQSFLSSTIWKELQASLNYVIKIIFGHPIHLHLPLPPLPTSTCISALITILNYHQYLNFILVPTLVLP